MQEKEGFHKMRKWRIAYKGTKLYSMESKKTLEERLQSEYLKERLYKRLNG
jgi:hypothetical protein